VDEPSADTGNLVGADGCPHSIAAEHNSAIHLVGGNGSGQWDHALVLAPAHSLLAGRCANDNHGASRSTSYRLRHAAQ
jgi:hypothetical protein